MSALSRLYRGENNIDFGPWWKRGVTVSLLLILISLVSLFTRGLNLGIEFEGGSSWEVKAPGVTVEQAREALTPLGLGTAKIQIVGGDAIRVQGPTEGAEKQAAVRDTLARTAGVSPSDVSVSNVGPSWGAEITAAAVRALVVFLVATMAWLSLRLEWKMAVAAIVAMVHDVIISVGFYSVFQRFQVTPPTVIAFLTILGYSIYDTVVVFDKVQENQGRVGLSSRLTYTQMTNLSMNQVLLRSINTSVVALIPVISMLLIGAFLLGAVTLEEFAVALAVGLLSGAYSSIFIATPLVVWLKEREPRNRQLRARIESTRERVAPAASAGSGASAESAAGLADAEGNEGTAAARAGTGTLTRSPASYGGTIPPRPRKKKKR